MRNKEVDAFNELLSDNKNVWKMPHEHHVIKYWLDIPAYYNNATLVLESTNEWLIYKIRLDKGEHMQIANPLEIFQ